MKIFLLILSSVILFFLPVNKSQAQDVVLNGAKTTPVNFPAGPCVYNWTNNTTSIGLAASGTGNIPSFTAVNTGSSPVVATITAAPVSSPGVGYITNVNTNALSVINLSTGATVTSIPVGVFPGAVTISPDGTRVYVANYTSNSVSVINTATNAVITTIPVASPPGFMAMSPDGSRIYITNQTAATVTVISTATNAVISTIPLSGIDPAGILISPDGSKAYVTASNQVFVINTLTNAIITSIPVGADPIDLAQSPDGKLLYVSNDMDGTISVINTLTDVVASTIPCGNNPYAIAISNDGSTLYVANSPVGTPGSITIINTATKAVENTIAVNLEPYGIDLSPDNSLLYVEPVNGSKMLAISTANNTVVSTIPVTGPFSFGNFISAGVGCGDTPVTYTITVNPTPASAPTITAGAATGKISVCAGTASASPQIQQFTVSGSNLTANITATAPAGFEVSLSAGSGYAGSVTIPQTSGTVNSTVVYVRSAATDAAGGIAGSVTLTSAGAGNQTVAVSGTVNALPTVNTVANQTVNNGAATTAISFAGTGNTFTWVNDTPGIGLAASGSGNIASFTAVNTGTSPVVATITVTPQVAGFAYVGNRDGNSISVINTITNAVVNTIQLPSQPFGVVVNHAGTRVFVTNYNSNTITVVNTMTNTVIDNVTVGANPQGIAISPDDSRLYITNGTLNSVAVINTGTNAVVANVAVGNDPWGIAVSPDGSKVYVTNFNSNSVSLISTATNSVVATITVGGNPEGIAITPNGSTAYVANNLSRTVSVIDISSNTVTQNITLNSALNGLAISPDGSTLYVPLFSIARLAIISIPGNQEIGTITAGTLPEEVCISPDGNYGYVTNIDDNDVSVFNAKNNTEGYYIQVGNAPLSFGNFISGGSGCAGTPTQFTITISPSLPTITATTASGTISACVGTASVSPQIQQFTVTGSGLTNNITATAPTGFEVSLSPGSGYAGSVTIPQTSGAVSGTVVYVRSAAIDAAGGIAGNVTLTSAGVSNQTVAVTGIVNALPTVNAVANQSVNNGAATAAINFTGTGGTFSWINDTPGIGLAASGTGNIASFAAVNTGNSPVVATIIVNPSSFKALAYLADEGSDVISVINTQTNQVIASIPVGSVPYGVSVSPDGTHVYVGNQDSNTVSVINTATNTVTATIPVDGQPYGVAVSPDGTRVYVADWVTNTVAVISTATNTVIANVPAGESPDGIALSPDGSSLYVSNYNSASVTVINTATNVVIATITVGSEPVGLSASPDGSRVYVANELTNTVSVLDVKSNTVVATIPVGSVPTSVSVSPDGSRVYVVNQASQNVSVINTATNMVTATIPVAGQPFGISASSDGSMVYVKDVGYNTLSVINTATNTVTATITADPFNLTFGNFIMNGTGCGGAPIKFTITVDPSPPTIIATIATGTISACAGAASVSPQIQQFTVSGIGLTGSITATAPAGFEISLAAGSGYGSSVTIPQNSGTATNTVVYVRSAASLSNGTTTATVQLSSPGAPGQTVSVTATVNPVVIPSLVISPSAISVCAGTPVTFTATPTNGGNSPVYQWQLNGNNTGTNSPTFSSSTFANGDVVSCVMTSSAVCVAPATTVSDTVTVNVIANVSPSVSIAASQNTICAGTLVTFTATPVNGGSTPAYQWLVNGINAGTNSTVFSGSNFADGDVVSCVMTGNAACAAPASVTSNSINVSVGAIVSQAISIAASQNNICPGTNVTFTATPTNGGSSPVYQWLLNGNNTGINSPTFASSTLLNGDVVSCRLTSNAMCLAQAEATSNNITMVINSQVAPAVSINTSANGVCAGTPVTFTASPTNGGNAPVYQWLVNGNNAGTNSPTFSSSAFANGDIVSCEMTSSLACAVPVTVASNNIIANIFPVPTVNAGGNKTIEKGGSVGLTATASGNIADITWSPSAGLDNNKILTPKATPASTTVYTITVQTAQGCMATDSVKITVLYGIVIPNTFTPNGDGVNDKWDIQNLSDYQNCMVSIFDRYGGEVFSSKGYANPWDGTMKGRPCPVGTYYYLINLNDGAPPLSGFVALIR